MVNTFLHRIIRNCGTTHSITYWNGLREIIYQLGNGR